MNKNKVSPSLLFEVSALSTKKRQVLVSSENFFQTKKFLEAIKLNFTPYRFANCFSLDCDSEDISILSDQNFVKYISRNNKVETSALNQDFLHLKNLTLNKYFGQGQTICVIDTGIFPHVDFLFPKSRLIKFIDLVNANSTPYDDNGHGTFVSGVAVGNGIIKNEHSGIASEANLIVIKALGENGSSNSNVILDAMQWVYENYKAFNISVVCMSFGADSENNNDPLSFGAETLWKKGITVVAAAGNSGPNSSTIKSPGNNPNIITVGALDQKSLLVADFSSRGPTIFGHKPDLLAPAVDIISCNNLKEPYTTMSGTSVATPIVAGVCAIIKSRYPNITNNEIKQFLLDNCQKITGNKDTEGAGYLTFENFKNQ